MKNNIKDVRGFTLIELLAVIVVLAIVMLAAVTAVIPRMNEARKQVFAIEANGAIDAAQAYFMNGSITGKETDKKFPANENGVECIEVSKLISEGFSDLDKSKYSGRVFVKNIGKGGYIYAVSLTNKQLMVVDKGFESGANKDVKSDDVVDYSSFTANETCPDKAAMKFPGD